jgi:hypothetical protein
MKHIVMAQTLDRQPPTTHTGSTCGQSCRGGFRTSCRTHWSSFSAGWPSRMSKASPKGAGALCVRGVLNARLRPGASMSDGGVH